MNDALAVGIIERFGQADKDVRNLVDGKGIVVDAFGEGGAGHVAHDIEQLAVILTHIMHGDNGGVFEFGDDLGLAFETVAQLGIFEQFAFEHFERNIPIEQWVIRAIDGCHAPDTQLFNDLIAVEFLYRHR